MNEDLLGKCRVCGREVSRRAKECPDCREPRPTMTEEGNEKKKRYEYRPIFNIIITIGLLVIGFLGLICSV